MDPWRYIIKYSAPCFHLDQSFFVDWQWTHLSLLLSVYLRGPSMFGLWTLYVWVMEQILPSLNNLYNWKMHFLWNAWQKWGLSTRGLTFYIHCDLYMSVETGSLTLLWWLWVFSLLCYLNLLNLDLEKPQAMKKFTEGDALQTLDPRLPPTSANNLALEKVLELALQCLGPTRQSRPSMRRCAEILWGIRKDYRELAASDLRSQSSHSQRSSSVREE